MIYPFFIKYCQGVQINEFEVSRVRKICGTPGGKWKFIQGLAEKVERKDVA